jgi:hypothetical protein
MKRNEKGQFVKENQEEAIEMKSNIEVNNNKESVEMNNQANVQVNNEIKKESAIMEKKNRKVEVSRMERSSNERTIYRTSLIMFDGQLEISGNIKVSGRRFNLNEQLPKVELSNEMCRDLGYKTPEELENAKKVNPYAQMWDSILGLHTFDISGMRRPYIDRHGKEQWGQHIWWGLETAEGQLVLFNEKLDFQIRQLIYRLAIESKVGTPWTNKDSIDVSEYVEKINKNFNVFWYHGYRDQKTGKPDYKKIAEKATQTEKSYRSWGYMGIVAPDAFDDKGNKLVLMVRVMIKKGRRGLYIQAPGININRLRLQEMVMDNPDLAKLVDVENEVLAKDVKHSDLPEDMQKLFNEKNGRLYMHTLEFVNFRTNGTVGFESDNERSDDGLFIGGVMRCNSQVKQMVIKQFIDDLKDHGIAIQDNIEMDADSEGDTSLSENILGEVSLG